MLYDFFQLISSRYLVVEPDLLPFTWLQLPVTLNSIEIGFLSIISLLKLIMGALTKAE